MSPNNIGKFSGKADDYARYRPSYPTELIEYLYETAQTDSAADIGAGTGIFTRLLMNKPWKVTAVEPNADMLRKILSHKDINVINGTAFFENENGLRFESLISTMKACRPEVTDRTVLNALNETRSYKRADTKELSIKFCDEKGKSVMTLEKRMVDLLNGS